MIRTPAQRSWPLEDVVVSAPGKCILMGEHAAVYGSPALVAAIDRRLRASLQTRAENRGLRLCLPQLGVRETVAWKELPAYARYCRRAWEAWSKAPQAEGLSKISAGDPAHVVKLAAGLALEHAAILPGVGAELTVESEIPLGSGFGSSAAAAVAVVRAMLAFCGEHPTSSELHRLSLEVERCQHGSPSGVDNATVIHGGVLWAERTEAGLQTTPLEQVDRALLERLRVFHSGPPAETTGEVVAAVRRMRDLDAVVFDRSLAKASDLTVQLRGHLETSSKDFAAVLDLVRRYQGWLEECGVVPAPVCRWVRQIEERGGAAKISGAGSLGGPGAGSLLVMHEDPAVIGTWDFLGACQSLDVELGAPGVQIEY